MGNDPLQAYATALAHLVEQAERAGVILTVERRPRLPLAMGNHYAHVEAYPSARVRLQLQEAAEAPRVVLQ